MVFVTGPLCSGKRTLRKSSAGGRCTTQDLADAAADLNRLADELADYDVVTAAEVGGGVVPIDPAARAAREAAPSGLSAARADCVVQMFCGLPTVLKENFPNADLFTAPRPDRVQRPEALSGSAGHPALARGLAQLCKADIDPKVVYISTLQRTKQTAEVLFPDAELVPVDGLKEMCFGSFEGRNYIEMEHDPDYQAWVAANCEQLPRR